MDRYTLDPHEFWADRFWVEDDEHDGYVFLGRAMLEIGHALFRDRWAGNEPEICIPRLPLPLPRLPRPLLLPPIPTVTRRDAESAAPDLVPWWSPTLSSESVDDQTPEPYLQEAPEANELLAEAKARWQEVLKATEWFLRRDILKSALRGLRGGSFLTLPRTYWNGEAENIRPRFLLCRMDYQVPFDRQPAGPAFIYVTTASLEPLLRALHQNHPEGPLVVSDQHAVEAHAAPTTPARAVVKADVVADTPPKSRHSPKRAAMERAVRKIWDGLLPGDIEIGLATAEVLEHFNDQPPNRAKPSGDYIRKYLNELRSASRP